MNVTHKTHDPARPIRVCFLIDNLSRAGTESQLLMLLNGLDRKRIEPYLVLLDGSGTASQSLEPCNCPVLRLGLISFFRFSFLPKLWQFMRFLRNEKIEVLQVYFRDSTYFGVLAGKLAGVSRIVLSRRNIGHWMSSLDRILMQICQRLADVTIVNCEACRQSVIEQERARPERVHVIPNGLDLSRFAHIPPYQTKPNGELRRIGVVANLRPVKGIDIFIRAAALVAATFPNVEFLIAGGGDPTPYRKLAEECGILEKVRFLGPIENIPDFLSQLDVAVLPSRAEGFSNSLLEYMAAGRPIVATDVGGNPTVIAHKSNGLLVPPEDVPSLGDAVLSLIREENSISRFGLASRDIIKRSFSQESVNRCYSELACKLLAR